MSALTTSFDVDCVDLNDKLVLVAIDAGFCRTAAEALLSYRERFNRDNPNGRPNPACEALGHLLQQAGFVLNGEDASKFPKLAGKVVQLGEVENIELVSEIVQ